MSEVHTALVRLDEGWIQALDKFVQPEVDEVFVAWTLSEWDVERISDALYLLVQREEHHEEWDQAAAVLTLAHEFDNFRRGLCDSNDDEEG